MIGAVSASAPGLYYVCALHPFCANTVHSPRRRCAEHMTVEAVRAIYEAAPIFEVAVLVGTLARAAGVVEAGRA